MKISALDSWYQVLFVYTHFYTQMAFKLIDLHRLLYTLYFKKPSNHGIIMRFIVLYKDAEISQRITIPNFIFTFTSSGSPVLQDSRLSHFLFYTLFTPFF